MIMEKCLRGMGFKNLEVFNYALLGKQVWKMINEPDALWVRMVKGLYYHDKSMLEVGKWARASWTWSSLIYGRDFIRENMIWQIVGVEKCQYGGIIR